MLSKQCLALASLGLWAASATSADITKPYDATSADACYQHAVDSALEGKLPAIEAALDAAIAADPDHAPSRAERGEIRADDRWVPADYAQHLARQDPNRQEYLDRLGQTDSSPAAQARLAKWCDRVGLVDEARPHWLAVLDAKPNSRAALKGLNAVWREGQLWDADLAAEAEEHAEEMARGAEIWEKRFRRFERLTRANDEDLAAIQHDLDASALAPIERRIAAFGNLRDPEDAERTQLLITAFLEATPDMPEVEVTASLCRISTMAGEDHRTLAVEMLKTRPPEDAMPMLLSYLIAPIDSEYRVDRDRLGNVTYKHTLKREGAEQDKVHERNRVATVSVNTTNWAPQGFRSVTTSDAVHLAHLRARVGGVRNELSFRQEAAETDEWVDSYNAAASEFNGRVTNSLSAVSKRSLGDEPREWWDYWRRYSGYDSYDRPVERSYDVSYTRDLVTADPTLIPPPPSRCECFVAGTQVWLRDGRKAIEDIRPGDLVLARDPHRGGLTYRAVLDTTVRQPSPMVEVVAGDETIRATVGHPFWVLGQGWRMAKQLVEGDILSTIDGPVTVTAVNDSQQATAFNLVVEGASNYYVGEHGVLVHDNTPRRPAVGLVASR